MNDFAALKELSGIRGTAGNSERRGVAHGMARLEPGLHVGESMLQLLIGSQRPSKRVPRERPVDSHVERCLHRPDGLSVADRYGESELPVDLLGSQSDPTDQTVGNGNPHVLERHHVETSGRVQRMHGLHADAIGFPGQEHLREARSGTTGHQQVLGAVLRIRPDA